MSRNRLILEQDIVHQSLTRELLLLERCQENLPTFSEISSRTSIVCMNAPGWLKFFQLLEFDFFTFDMPFLNPPDHWLASLLVKSILLVVH